VESFSTLRHVQSAFRCPTCHLDGAASLDDYIQISFSVSPQVRRLAFHDPESLAPRDYIRRYRWSQGAALPNGIKFLDILGQLSQIEDYVAPGEKKTYSVVAVPGLLSGSELADRAEFAFPVEGPAATAPQRASVVLKNGKAEQSPERLRPGPCGPCSL